MWLTKQVTSNHIHSCPFFKHDNQRLKAAFIPFPRFNKDQFRAKPENFPGPSAQWTVFVRQKVGGEREERESVASVTPVGPEREKPADPSSKSSAWLLFFVLIWYFLCFTYCWQYTLVLIYWWLCTNPSKTQHSTQGKTGFESQADEFLLCKVHFLQLHHFLLVLFLEFLCSLLLQQDSTRCFKSWGQQWLSNGRKMPFPTNTSPKPNTSWYWIASLFYLIAFLHYLYTQTCNFLWKPHIAA